MSCSIRAPCEGGSFPTPCSSLSCLYNNSLSFTCRMWTAPRHKIPQINCSQPVSTSSNGHLLRQDQLVLSELWVCLNESGISSAWPLSSWVAGSCQCDSRCRYSLVWGVLCLRRVRPTLDLDVYQHNASWDDIVFSYLTLSLSMCCLCVALHKLCRTVCWLFSSSPEATVSCWYSEHIQCFGIEPYFYSVHQWLVWFLSWL